MYALVIDVTSNGNLSMTLGESITIVKVTGFESDAAAPHVATTGLNCAMVSIRAWFFTPNCLDEVIIAYAGKQYFVTVNPPPPTTYTLTVTGGTGSTGSGNYEAGKEVDIIAGTAPAGKQFKNWTSSNGGTFADASASSTKFTMPSNSVTVTANWEDIPVTTYTLTVSGGTGSTGSGNYEAGKEVNISAGTAPAGKQFKNWTSSNGGSFTNASASSTKFTMPSNSVTVTANWEDIPVTTYTLTVSGGTGSIGSGNYEAGKKVDISVGMAPVGKQFKNWTSSNGGSFGDANASSTKFTMPSNSVTVTANWEDDIPDGVESVQNEKMSVKGGEKSLHIKASKDGKADIYTFAGIKVREISYPAGENTVAVNISSGMYVVIVAKENKTFKVYVR
jgi:hypothetical protein